MSDFVKGTINSNLKINSVNVSNSNPLPVSITGDITNFPNAGLIASSSGIIIIKDDGGKLYRVDIIYTGSSDSGLWIQLHDASLATIPTTSTLRLSRPINSSINIIEIEFYNPYIFTLGIKVIISSTKDTSTISASENFKLSAMIGSL